MNNCTSKVIRFFNTIQYSNFYSTITPKSEEKYKLGSSVFVVFSIHYD